MRQDYAVGCCRWQASATTSSVALLGSSSRDARLKLEQLYLVKNQQLTNQESRPSSKRNLMQRIARRLFEVIRTVDL
jgi:hypothetical protein